LSIVATTASVTSSRNLSISNKEFSFSQIPQSQMDISCSQIHTTSAPADMLARRFYLVRDLIKYMNAGMLSEKYAKQYQLLIVHKLQTLTTQHWVALIGNILNVFNQQIIKSTCSLELLPPLMSLISKEDLIPGTAFEIDDMNSIEFQKFVVDRVNNR
jgi:hypothetical protein